MAGWSTACASGATGREWDRRHRITTQLAENLPIAGPIFSGPQQKPFVCKTTRRGLGKPIVDNQAGKGFRVLAEDGSIAGYSRDCSAPTHVDWLYRSHSDGNVQPLPAGPPPADLATTTTLDGRTVAYIVRRSAARSTASSTRSRCSPTRRRGRPTPSLWNRRLVYCFDGGVAIGRNQGTPGGSALSRSARRAATPSRTRPGRARATTTTWCSAARRR